MERDCDAHLEAYLAISILHPPLTQKIDISDSRAVIGYVEHQHTICSFRVTSVRTHKMVYRKVVVFRVWIHNSPIVFRIIALTKRIDTFNIRAFVRLGKRPYTTFSYRVARVIAHKNGIQESHCDACFWS